jgi:hypothetical protein
MVSKFREGEVVSDINVPTWHLPASNEVIHNEPEGGDYSRLIILEHKCRK